MTVRIKFGPTLRKYIAGYDHNTGLEFENAAGKELRQIMDEVGIPVQEISSVIVNHFPSRLSHVVEEGDEIFVLRVVGGG